MTRPPRTPIGTRLALAWFFLASYFEFQSTLYLSNLNPLRRRTAR